LTRNWHSSEANPKNQSGKVRKQLFIDGQLEDSPCIGLDGKAGALGLREKRGGLRGHLYLYLDYQNLSVQPCGGKCATSYHRRPRQGRFSELDVVSCARNVLQEHLGRRVAMAAPVRCNPFEEHQDLGDCLTCIRSSAEHVACGTLKKALALFVCPLLW